MVWEELLQFLLDGFGKPRNGCFSLGQLWDFEEFLLNLGRPRKHVQFSLQKQGNDECHVAMHIYIYASSSHPL